jgi:hypothetical protein
LESRITGRRPNRSASAPWTGEKMNCITANAVPKMPKIAAAPAMSPPCSFRMSCGNTGMMIPNEIMSRRTVMKMKTNAARVLVITRGILSMSAHARA